MAMIKKDQTAALSLPFDTFVNARNQGHKAIQTRFRRSSEGKTLWSQECMDGVVGV